MKRLIDNLLDYLFWESIFWHSVMKDLERRFERKTENWPLFV